MDSGQLMIVDPCYVDDDDPFDYDKMLENYKWDDEEEADKVDHFPFRLGVVFRTPGDGRYDVYAKYDGKRIVEVKVVLSRE